MVKNSISVAIILLCIQLISCSGSKSEQNLVDSTLTDSTALPSPMNESVSTNVSQLLSYFPKNKIQSIVELDTAWLAGFSNKKSLNSEQVQQLMFAFRATEGDDEAKYHMQSFYNIDSIKKAGKYEAWCETLDIGMMKNAECYSLCHYEIPGGALLLWTYKVATYEACPFFNGEFIMYSVVDKNNNLIGTKLASEFSGGGDPPVMGSTEMIGTLQIIDNHTEFVAEIIETQEDLDQREHTESFTRILTVITEDALIGEDKKEEQKPVLTKLPDPLGETTEE